MQSHFFQFQSLSKHDLYLQLYHTVSLHNIIRISYIHIIYPHAEPSESDLPLYQRGLIILYRGRRILTDGPLGFDGVVSNHSAEFSQDSSSWWKILLLSFQRVEFRVEVELVELRQVQHLSNISTNSRHNVHENNSLQKKKKNEHNKVHLRLLFCYYIVW